MTTTFTFNAYAVTTPTDMSWQPGAGGVLWRQDVDRMIWVDTVVVAYSLTWNGQVVWWPPTVSGRAYLTEQSVEITVTYQDGGPPAPPPPSSTCVRRAWLTLPTAPLLPLEDKDAGYFCTSFELANPDIRDVVNNRPDHDGVDDRTRYWGSRGITAEIVTSTGWGATIDQVATMFGPFMVPSARPVLHYVLDRPGAPERAMVVRAANYTWKVEGDTERKIQLQWVAPDPVAYDPQTRTATAWAGSTVTAGRTYNLTFPRTYPAGGMPPTTGTITAQGDTPIRPLVRIFGPITNPQVRFTYLAGGRLVYQYVAFKSGFTIDAGQWVDVDTQARRVLLNSDPARSLIASVDWSTSVWPLLPAQTTTTVSLVGGGATSSTQAVVSWQDGYLS